MFSEGDAVTVFNNTDGNITITCSITTPGSSWIALLGGTDIDSGRGVAVDSSDNIIVVGYNRLDGAGSLDALVAKYNSSGTLQWSKTLGGTGARLDKR